MASLNSEEEMEKSVVSGIQDDTTVFNIKKTPKAKGQLPPISPRFDFINNDEMIRSRLMSANQSVVHATLE